MYPSAQQFAALKDTKLVPVALFGLAPAYNVGLPSEMLEKGLKESESFFFYSIYRYQSCRDVTPLFSLYRSLLICIWAILLTGMTQPLLR